MSRINKSTLAVAALSLGLGAAGLSAGAQAAEEPPDGQRAERSVRVGGEFEILERPAGRFEQSIETHGLFTRYESLTERARDLGVAPKGDLLAQSTASPAELRDGIRDLKAAVERAEREAEAEQAASDLGLAGGVSQATLDAIAACESGGDPTAVNPAGYYGKYQFDMGTWASVGGSGNPAEASEAEQDYRASLLYSQAGSSPWPVCGA